MAKQTRSKQPTKPNPLESQWAREYQSWFYERFQQDAPHLASMIGPEGTNYTCRMAYNMHIAPTSNIKNALSALRSTLPKAASYKVRVSREDGSDESEISSSSDGLEIINALVYFREGTKVKVNVLGGVGDEWRQNAGFIFANLLGDLSFNYEVELPIPLEKFDRLTSIIKRT